MLGSVHAREKLDTRMVDSITYQLYLEKSWDDLIQVGKEALNQDIDYFYLRVRIGVAYFELKKYIVAAEHFSKAYQFNSSDAFTNEYLYLSLLYANRPGDAAIIADKLDQGTRTKLNAKRTVVDQVCIEAGPTINPGFNNKTHQNLMGSDGIYGETDQYGNSFYSHADITFNLCKFMNLTVGYSYLDFQKRKTIQNVYYTDRLDSTVTTLWGYQNYYSFPKINTDTTYSYKMRQDEVYLASTFRPSASFRVTPYFHLIHVRYSNLQVQYQANTVQDTSYFLASDSSYHTFPFTRSVYKYPQTDTSFYNYVVGISLYHDFSRVTIGLFGSYSNLNNQKQGQAGYSITYFPLGNLNLYGTLSFTGFVQGTDARILTESRVGGKIASWLWLEGNLLYGDYTNSNISNGFVVFNNSDKIRYRAGGNLTFVASKHLQISVIYQFFSKENAILYYTWDTTTVNELTATAQTRYQKYSTHTIIGGITWKL